jgi:hypothetical protein
MPEHDVYAIPMFERQAIFVRLQNSVRAVLHQLKHLPVAIAARQHRLLNAMVFTDAVRLDFVSLQSLDSQTFN